MFVGAVHLVADRLKWFGDEESDVETILAAKGEKVLRSLTGKQAVFPLLLLAGYTISASSTINAKCRKTARHSSISEKGMRTANGKFVFLVGTVVPVLFSSAAHLLDFEGMCDGRKGPTHGPHNIVTES